MAVRVVLKEHGDHFFDVHLISGRENCHRRDKPAQTDSGVILLSDSHNRHGSIHHRCSEAVDIEWNGEMAEEDSS